jgi:type II secretory ATPase GspE/PulE/Tfp pilus assembly ATPase PilB-like protein
MRTLREDGVRKAVAGLTTPGEIMKTTVADVD